MANFKCPKTGKEFTVSSYSMKIVDGKSVYSDKWGELKNPDNGEALLYVESEFKGFCTTHLGSKSERKTKMQDHLKKRAKDHYQTDTKYQKRKQGDLLGTTKHNK